MNSNHFLRPLRAERRQTPSAFHRFRLVRLLSAALVAALVASVLTVASGAQSPAAAQPGEPLPIVANANGSLPVYDTAGELPMLATFPEIETYLDHLQREGFAGTWVSFFDLLKANINQRSPEGDLAATIDGSGFFVLNPNYLDRVERILDMARDRDLTVSIVPVWAAVYVNGRGNQCNAPNSGPLFEWNAYGIGRQLAERFAGHEGVGHWIMGGDNYCGHENVEIWRQLSYGLADYGANQPTTYHSPAIQDRQKDNLWENWLDFAAPQTGHCQNHERTKSQLQQVVNATNKPVLAGELRYEGIQPAWYCPEHGPGRPVTPDDVEADVRNAMNSGVAGILFGHNERWQWGIGLHGSSGGGGGAAIASLGSSGEKRMLSILGIERRVCDQELKAAHTKAARQANNAAKDAAEKAEELKVANRKAARVKAAANKAAEAVKTAKKADKAEARERAAKKKAASEVAAKEAAAAKTAADRAASKAKNKAAAARAAKAAAGSLC